MNAFQIITMLVFFLVNGAILYFISNKFEKGWARKLLSKIKNAEKGTDMGLMTVRMVVVIEVIAVFIIMNNLQ